MYPGQSLNEYKQALESVQSGIADIANVPPHEWPDKMVLDKIFSAPELHTHFVQGALWHRDLYEEFFMEPHAQIGIRSIGFWAAGSYDFFSIKDPLYKIEDFEGLSVRSFNPTFEEIISRMGGLPITVPYTEAYDALQKGMLDVAPCYASSLLDMGWYEAGDPGYFIDIGGLPTGSGLLAINVDVFNSLPADLRKIVIEAGHQAWTVEKSRNVARQLEMAAAKLGDEGIEMIDWDDDEKQRLADTIKLPMLQAMADELDAKGVRGSELLAALKALADEKKYINVR
jgi:TRAP-type C4-dicarboxylate transport system substrate-binding protein